MRHATGRGAASRLSRSSQAGRGVRRILWRRARCLTPESGSRDSGLLTDERDSERHPSVALAVRRNAAVSDDEKPSFSELDRKRRERKRNGGGQQRPRGGKAQKRSRAASAAYRRRVEEKLFGKKGDRARLRLAQRLREAHGTANLQRAYREYVREAGVPEDFGLLALLLDLGDERDLRQVTEAICSRIDSLQPEQRSLLRSRLRNLEMSTPSDAIADAAADLLAQL